MNQTEKIEPALTAEHWAFYDCICQCGFCGATSATMTPCTCPGAVAFRKKHPDVGPFSPPVSPEETGR